MERLLWGELEKKVEESNLQASERFFLINIKKGLELKGDTLSELDLIGLTRTIDADGLTQLDNLLSQKGIDRIAWNTRLVEALRKSFEYEVNNIKTDKDRNKRIGIKYDSPHESWNFMLEDLIENSSKAISGIVQNWYHKYWSVQARQSATKTIATGCLIPISMFILFIILIPKFIL